ncbi:hypothetical protein TRAPUB_5371 [Trametes pubescens]|uniref:Uncharacterized protein n=1 Tax=Trametes pubescens TaxID=154538 RepID=A0A1M2V8K0_TRAPU|nr:hypothetical protein TRAPUB_5371 [Trametes pubescens]
MSAKLRSVPIVECAACICSLAVDARNIHRAFAETQCHILRISDSLKPSELSSAWCTYTEGDIDEDETDDMIEELSVLLKTDPAPGTAIANKASRRAWGRAISALAMLQQPEDTKNVPSSVARASSQGCGDIAGIISAAQNMWAGPYAPANGQNTATSDLRTVPPPANPATPSNKTLVGLIKGVLAGLTAQVPKFNAFSEVAKHEKRTALQNMHTCVAVSATLWKQLAVVLTDGYARLQK